jgi:hypothetical protein
LPPSRFRDPDLPVRPPRSLPRLRVLTRGQSSALDAVAAAWKANSGKTATNEDLKPVLVRMHNGWQLGFLADAFNDGQVAVFLPGAPDPSSGVVQIVSANHITPLNISYLDALACLEHSGRGLSKLLASSSFEEQN